MKVKIKAFAGFRHILGKEQEVELKEGARMEDLLEMLCKKHPELQSLLFDGPMLRPEVNILARGLNIEGQKGLQTEIRDGDEVAVFPAAIGG